MSLDTIFNKVFTPNNFFLEKYYDAFKIHMS